jgi:hypothetical protein
MPAVHSTAKERASHRPVGHENDKDTLNKFRTDGVVRQHGFSDYWVGVHCGGRGRQWYDYRKLYLVLTSSPWWVIQLYGLVQSGECMLSKICGELCVMDRASQLNRPGLRVNRPFTLRTREALKELGVSILLFMDSMHWPKCVWDTLPMYMCNKEPHYPDRVKSRTNSTMIGNWMRSQPGQRRLAEYYLNRKSLNDVDAISVILTMI